MQRGQQVMLRFKNKPYPVEVICDYREDKPPYPAIRIKKGGNEMIVKPDEIMTEEELRSYELEKTLKKQFDKYVKKQRTCNTNTPT
jgi:hypothetical protein